MLGGLDPPSQFGKVRGKLILGHCFIGELGAAADQRTFNSIEPDRASLIDAYRENHCRAIAVGQ